MFDSAAKVYKWVYGKLPLSGQPFQPASAGYWRWLGVQWIVCAAACVSWFLGVGAPRESWFLGAVDGVVGVPCECSGGCGGVPAW